jgi:hypothetical protein
MKDPACIAEKILSPAERRSIEERWCVGNMQGAGVADFLGIAHDADMFLEVTEPWYETGHGEEMRDRLYMIFHGDVGRDRIAELISYATLLAVGLLGEEKAKLAKVTFDSKVDTYARLMLTFEAGQVEVS